MSHVIVLLNMQAWLQLLRGDSWWVMVAGRPYVAPLVLCCDTM